MQTMPLVNIELNGRVTHWFMSQKEHGAKRVLTHSKSDGLAWGQMKFW